MTAAMILSITSVLVGLIFVGVIAAAWFFSQKAEIPVFKPTHLHLKSQKVYEKIGEVRLEIDNSEAVLYRDKDNIYWVRSKAEFIDGRFQIIPHGTIKF